MMNSEKKQLNVKIEEELHEQLDSFASQKGISKAGAVRMLLKENVEA